MCEVVECALVALSVTMLRTKNVTTLASSLYESYFLGTLPAFVEVALDNNWLGLTDRKMKRKISSSSLSNL